MSFFKGVTITNRILAGTPVYVPVADFSANILSGNFPLTVNFTDLSTNNPTSWLWDFKNDGSATSTLQNPSYTYTAAGTYTVKLTATNAAGSNIITKINYITVTIPNDDEVFATPGTFSWVVPEGVTSICAVAVGAGGGGTVGFNGPASGGGGALAYVNNISVTPGETLTVYVGTGTPSASSRTTQPTNIDTYLARGATKLVHAGGGRSAIGTPSTSTVLGAGGTVLVGTGGAGGSGAKTYFARYSGGGGAGGYSGTGGRGGGTWNASSSTMQAAFSGAGGGAAGGSGHATASTAPGGGGGTGLYGVGSNGTANGSPYQGQGGQGGSVANGSGTTGTTRGLASGGWPGGGMGSPLTLGGKGGDGGLRIIWGAGRSFPSNAA